MELRFQRAPSRLHSVANLFTPALERIALCPSQCLRRHAPVGLGIRETCLHGCGECWRTLPPKQDPAASTRQDRRDRGSRRHQGEPAGEGLVDRLPESFILEYR
jgi:hypothetical protein